MRNNFSILPFWIFYIILGSLVLFIIPMLNPPSISDKVISIEEFEEYTKVDSIRREIEGAYSSAMTFKDLSEILKKGTDTLTEDQLILNNQYKKAFNKYLDVKLFPRIDSINQYVKEIQ